MAGWEPDRRELLQAAGTLAAVAALRGCGDNQTPALGGVFEVDAGSAIVWAGGEPGAAVTVTVLDAGDAVVAMVTGALDDAAGTVALPVSGLAAGTRHRAVIDVGGTTAGTFAFTTAPADDDGRAVRIVWSGDFDLDPEFASPILDAATALAPDLVVSLGDWPYADNAPGAMTLDDYRDRHWAARADGGTQRWMRTVGFRAIYDDHEVRNDWDAGSWAREPDRHVGALAAWDEYFPVRGATPGVRYRSWRWGAQVEAFMLDCRRYRVALETADADGKTMLGAEQRQWLIDGVLASTARFKLVFTTVPLDFGFTTEHWNAYTWERGVILDALAAGGAHGVVFLCADSHWFASHRVAHGAREFQAGPIARGLPEVPAPGAGELVQVRAYNVGVLDIDAVGNLTVRCIDASGATRFTETLTADDLALS